MRYLNEFLMLKCAGDILNIVNPIQNITKEISESLGIISKIRNILLNEPNTYTIYDLCAGNALTSVILSFLLPVKKCIAIDIINRKRNWEKINKFKYKVLDINNIKSINKKSILIKEWSSIRGPPMWTNYLISQIKDSNIKVIKDDFIQSPVNNIIIAERIKT